MSAKYELDGYQPLRPWNRGVSYLGFIAVVVMAYVRIQPGFPAMSAFAFLVALLVSFVCALFSFWDARVTAALRKKGARKVRVVRGFMQPSFTFFEREAGWEYFDDPNPQTAAPANV